MKSLLEKQSLLYLTIVDGISSSIGIFGAIYGLLRLIFQNSAISHYRYDIDAQFKVETNALLFGSIGILVGSFIMGIVIRNFAKRIDDTSNSTYNADIYSNKKIDTKPIFSDKNTNSTSNSKHTTTHENEWVCPNCGSINQNYVGTCGCGTKKP